MIQDTCFFSVCGWMVNGFHLKGNELLVYAIIYGFSQDCSSGFYGDLEYIGELCGGITTKTVASVLRNLEEKELILMVETDYHGHTITHYSVNVEKISQLGKNFPDDGKNFPNSENFSGHIVLNCQYNNQFINIKNKKDIEKENIIKEREKTHESVSNETVAYQNGRKPRNISNEFDELWKLYPKKQGKSKALAAYYKATGAGTTFEEVKAGIERYNAHIRATKTETRFIKQGSTYFSGHCWEDEYNDSAAEDQSLEKSFDTNDFFDAAIRRHQQK